MTDLPLEQLIKSYITFWQPRLRLMDWDIFVEVKELSAPEHLAKSETEWRNYRALLTIPPNFAEKLKERRVYAGSVEFELECSVVHELLHISEQPLADQLDQEIRWCAGSRDNGGIIGAELRSAWRDYREWWINQMVRILVPPR